MKIQHFFDEATNTLTYIVYDEVSKDAVIIDPVLNFHYPSSTIRTDQVQKLIQFLQDNDLYLHFILETHVHADHLSSAAFLKKRYSNAQIAIGERVTMVQKAFQKIFNLSDAFKVDGRQFDKLIADQEVLFAGVLKIQAFLTEGHTPCCLSYLVNEEAIFTGDALFMPDYGTGRCDFPGGSAKNLYCSIQNKLYLLPKEIKVFVGHDYMPGGRSLLFESSIEEEKEKNVHLNFKKTEADFVNMRENRDKTLLMPQLFYPSLQININAGNLPKLGTNGVSYLKPQFHEN